MESNPIDPSKLVSETVDGVAGEIPVISYTEKVIEEKQAQLKKYLHENYAKLQSVEKELESLNLELKLTSGSKKAGLELLRSKVEKISEKIHAAKVKESQAKKTWEESSKVVADLEEEKKKLCDDLYLMVHENAMKQYEKLEALTRKLDLLNPGARSGMHQTLEDLRSKIGPRVPPIDALSTSAPGETSTASKLPEESSKPTAEEKSKKEVSHQEGASHPGKESVEGDRGGNSSISSTSTARLGGRGRGRGRGRGTKGPLILKPGAGSDAGSNSNGESSNPWTGAGFDVDNI